MRSTELPQHVTHAPTRSSIATKSHGRECGRDPRRPCRARRSWPKSMRAVCGPPPALITSISTRPLARADLRHATYRGVSLRKGDLMTITIIVKGRARNARLPARSRCHASAIKTRALGIEPQATTTGDPCRPSKQNLVNRHHISREGGARELRCSVAEGADRGLPWTARNNAQRKA